MAATATTATHLHIQSSPFSCRQSDRIFAGGFSYAFPTRSFTKSHIILASRKDDSSFNIKVTASDPAPFNSQVLVFLYQKCVYIGIFYQKHKNLNFEQGEDFKYVLKLAGGSVLGAAAIKYGSALFPEITTPNILLALSMISGPVILALLLLIKKSSPAN